MNELAYKFIELEARSRRNNLIFWGFVEIPNENSFAIIRVLSPKNLTLTLKICIPHGLTGPDREESAVEIQEFPRLL